MAEETAIADPPQQTPGPGDWLSSMQTYLSKKPDASDEELYKQFPQLNKDSKRLDAAMSYFHGKQNGMTDEDAYKMYPDLLGPSPITNVMNRMAPKTEQPKDSDPGTPPPATGGPTIHQAKAAVTDFRNIGAASKAPPEVSKNPASKPFSAYEQGLTDYIGTSKMLDYAKNGTSPQNQAMSFAPVTTALPADQNQTLQLQQQLPQLQAQADQLKKELAQHEADASGTLKDIDQSFLKNSDKYFKDGQLDYGKVHDEALAAARQYGGDRNVAEVIYNRAANALKFHEVEPYVKDEFKKLTGKTPEDFLGGASAQADNIKTHYLNDYETEARRSQDLINQKAKDFFATKYQPALDAAAQQYGVNSPQVQQAMAAGKQAWAEDLRGIQVRENGRLNRIRSEMARGMQNDFETVQDKNQDLMDQYNRIYNQAYQNVQKSREDAKAGVYNLPLTDGNPAALFMKSLWSGVNSWAASRGTGLVAAGFNNPVSDWLRSRQTQAELNDIPDGSYVNPGTYVTKAGKMMGQMLPDLAVTAATKNPTLSGLEFTASSTLSGMGDVYNQAKAEGANEEEAQRKAQEFAKQNFIATLPANMLMSSAITANLKGVGGLAANITKEGVGALGAALPQQYLAQAQSKDAKSLGDFMQEDAPKAALDNILALAAGVPIMRAVGHVTKAMGDAKANSAQQQLLSDILDKQGVNAAHATLELQYLNGGLDAEGLAGAKKMLNDLISTKAGLAGLNVHPDLQKLFLQKQTEIAALKAARPPEVEGSGLNEALLKVYDGRIKELEGHAQDIIDGKSSYLKMTTPNGVDFVVGADKANSTLEDPDIQQDIASGQLKVQAIGDEKEIQPIKDRINQLTPATTPPVEEGAPIENKITEVRHGVTPEDDKGVTSGPTDVRLNDEGRQKAGKMADDLQEAGVTRVVSSGLPRAVETGKIVADQLGIHHDQVPELNSWNIGEFDKTPDTEFKKAENYFVKNPDATEFEGKKLGESFNQYKDRVIAARQKIENENQGHSLLVNHGGNINIWDAYKKNGDQWTVQAGQDYLNAKDTPPAEVPLEAKVEPNNKTLPGRSSDFSDFYHRFKSEVAQVPDSYFDFRMDSPQSQKDREGAIKDIDKGKDSKRATVFLDELQRQYDNGTLVYTRGRGNHVEKFGIPVKDWLEVNNQAQHEVIEDIQSGQFSDADLHKWLAEEAGKTYEDGEESSETRPASGNHETGDQAGEHVPTVRAHDEAETGTGNASPEDEPRSTADRAARPVREAGTPKGGAAVQDETRPSAEERELHNDLAARLGKKPLPKLGEASEGDSKPFDSVSGALKEISAHFKDDPLIQRVIRFLKPIMDANPDIHFDNEYDFEGKPGVGYSEADGRIGLNYDALGNKDDLYRTALHEMMHAATRSEIEKSPAFKDELRDLLGDIRAALKVPDSDGLIPLLVQKGVIPADKYGTANEHEMIAEVFSNQKFNDMLRGIDYKGDSLLKRVFLKIAQYFSKQYKALASAKGSITANNMADYLMNLTEKVVKGGGNDNAGSLAMIGNHSGDPLEDFVREKLDEHKEASIKKALVDTGGMKDTDADALIDKVRNERTQSPEEIIRDAMAIGKAVNKQPILPKKAKQIAESTLGKSLKRWFYDGVDDVSDVKSIIRKNKGNEEFNIDKIYHATRKLVSFWNTVPADKQMAFMLMVEKPELLAGQPQETRDMADAYRQRLDDVFDMLQKNVPGLNMVQDYFPHFWDNPDKARNFLANTLSKAPLEGGKGFAKKRFLETIVSGLKGGLKLATTNPEEIVRLAEANAWKFKTARDILGDMDKKGLVQMAAMGEGPDGWQTVKDPAFQNMAMRMKSFKTGDSKMAALYMPPDVAKLMNEYLSIGLKGPVKDFIQQYNNIKNLFQLGVGFFHVGTTSTDALVTGMTNGIQKLTALNPMGLVDIATLGNLPATIARGFKAKSEWNKGKVTADTQALMDANAKVGKQKMYSIDAKYNMMKAFGRLRADGDFSQIPKLAWNALLWLPEAINKPLMEHWVPALKVGGYLRSLDAEIASRKNMTPEELQNAKQKIWDQMDDRLGQVVYDNIFMNKAYKDMAHLAIRSAGWTGGTIRAVSGGVAEIPRSANRLVQGQGLSQRTAYLLALPMTVGIMGAMYQYLMTGKGPDEMKDYFFPKDGTKEPDGTDHRLVFPSYMKDILAYGQTPVKTLLHKTAPALNELAELYNNKDFYSEKIYNKDDPMYQKGLDILKYEAQTMIPFSFKTNKNDNGTLLDQVTTRQGMEQKFGLMPAPKERERSDTQNKIMQAFTDQIGTKEEGVTHAQMEQQIARRHLRDFLHDGGNYKDASDEWKTAAAIKPQALAKFIHDSKMDPYEERFKALTPETKVKLWKEMDADDRAKYGKWIPIKFRDQLNDTP